MNYITTWCRVKDGVATIDGKQFLSGGASFQDLMSQLYQQLSPEYPKFFKMDNQSKLGFIACELLVKGRKNFDGIDTFQIGVILSNSSSSLDTDSKFFESMKQIASPSLFVYTLPNIVNGEISIRHGLRGESNFFISPQFEADIVCMNCDEILMEKGKICIAGWVDVLGDDYDAFLYLVEKKREGVAIEHTSENAMNLYYNNN